MFGQLSHDEEVNVSAKDAWELYSTLELGKFVVTDLPDVVCKVDLVEGDGGVGTVLKVYFPPGTPGLTFYKEKFTKIDNENRVKEAEVVEGGYLDFGFNSYLVRFEIIEKGEDSCIIKNTIEYDVKEEATANAALVTAEPFARIAKAAAPYIIKNKAK